LHLSYKTRGVSCICQQAVKPAVCRSGSRSAPPMWSRDAATRTANCSCFHAMWFCRAASASMSRPISADRLLRASSAAAAAKARRKTGPRTGPRPVPRERKKLWPVEEPVTNTIVDGEAPGEAPQPLTLNHPASNPGRFWRPGFIFSGLGTGTREPDLPAVTYRRWFTRPPGNLPKFHSLRQVGVCEYVAL
jgi:hypothetical protein